MEFEQATCVVTGAASGIGRATADLLRDAGARIVAVDRDEERLAELPAEDLRLPADLSDAAAVAAVAVRAIEAGATHLVNAAGIVDMRRIDDVDVELWERVFAVNARAVFLLCQAICPTLAAGGAVVNLSSSAAKTGSTLEGTSYAAAKAAVLSLTRSFAHAHAARGVRVNAVCPGIIETPMQDQVLAQIAAVRGTTPEAVDRARLATVPLGRAASAAECAEVVAFLLSPRAGYMTGQSVNVTGGLVME